MSRAGGGGGPRGAGRKGVGLLAFVAAALAALAIVVVFGPGRERRAPVSGEEKGFVLSASRAYFVDNQAVGRLYVVEGSVANQTGQDRCRIAIKALLVDAAGAVVAERSLEAGPTASIGELRFLSRDDLCARLSAPTQEPCRSTRVEPGGSAQFMAVFENPPDTAASYRLVVSGFQTVR